MSCTPGMTAVSFWWVQGQSLKARAVLHQTCHQSTSQLTRVVGECNAVGQMQAVKQHCYPVFKPEGMGDKVPILALQ